MYDINSIISNNLFSSNGHKSGAVYFETAKTMIENAISQSDMRGSLSECHSVGIDSIVLFDNRHRNGGMARIFVANEGRHRLNTLYNKHGDYVLGVHNHRFNIVLIPLVGKLINYTVAPDINGSEKLFKYQFSSGLTGTMKSTLIEEVKVSSAQLQEVYAGDVIQMESKDLHTVIVPDVDCKSGMTAWMVLEGADIDNSFIYSRNDNLDLNSEGLYKSMDKLQANNILERILQHI